ncbi:MAG: zinc ribbon domain-containing protein [Thermoplasmata archaeon]|nr:zinc ribbon domain-containing protein [Thermoplasmata archaeon]
MPPSSDTTIRTVVLPHLPEPDLVRALLDVRSAVNHLLPDWRAHPQESRFDATKRVYPLLRARYPHLASGWAITMTNETSAVLHAWDRSLRRARRLDPARFERMQRAMPHRRRLKASLHHHLFRWDTPAHRLTLTLRPGVYVRFDLSRVVHPLFWKHGSASNWNFGLSVTPSALLFHFHVPHRRLAPPHDAGVDLNFQSADIATSDGQVGQVDLRPITRIQVRMVRKRQSIQRAISKDLRHQRAVLRRYHRREQRRVTPLLHRAANDLLEKVDDRVLVMEDLSSTTESILQRRGGHEGPALRRRLSAWTHGRLAEIVSYKARTPIVWLNPKGTSQECPRCGGQLALPSEGRERSHGPMTRQTVCGECGGVWHRDRAAAIVILTRGRRLLRGATVPPGARNALLEAATWRRREEGGVNRPARSGLAVEPMREDDAKFGTPKRKRGFRIGS